jgi:pyruvate kinase
MVTWESKGAPAMGRRAKIVYTLGPATSSAEQIMELVAAGLDVARLNMSHGSHDTHLAAYLGAAVGAKALVAFTMTGETARRLARYRSPIPLLAFSTESATRSQLPLTWVPRRSSSRPWRTPTTWSGRLRRPC